MSEDARSRAFKWLHNWHHAERRTGVKGTHDSPSIDTCTRCQGERANFGWERKLFENPECVRYCPTCGAVSLDPDIISHKTENCPLNSTIDLIAERERLLKLLRELEPTIIFAVRHTWCEKDYAELKAILGAEHE